jgi:citrate lyase beta subunit
MRHFDFLSDSERRRLFLHPPVDFDSDSETELLAVALGATLYSPATRPTLAKDIARRAAEGVVSSVVCLEDAIADTDVEAGELNAIAQLRDYAESRPSAPLIFVRVRSAAQIPVIVGGLGEHERILAGFVLPKFTAPSGAECLDAVVAASERLGRRLLVMPVLESPEIAYAETRVASLVATRSLLERYRDHVLAIRLGATDLSSAFALRRSRDLTVYNVRIVADVIADVVNIFGRADASGYIVTGAVWEHFTDSERMFKPQLRTTPFVEHSERALRAQLIAGDLDGLIREVALDKANGLTGKTVIHPTHVAAVHALSVVTHEEYCDALDIAQTSAGGGVAASSYRNKMNESKPHAAWARRILLRGRVFGVAHEGMTFVDLLGASLHQ